jgi:hypothetical protein
MKTTIAYKPENMKIVDIDLVRPNTWNPKPDGGKEYEKVKRSIETNGQRAYPVAVRQNDGYEIIDGAQRYKACVELGFNKILIYDEGKMSDQQAKQLTIWYQQQVPFDQIELAYMIKDMDDLYENLELPFEPTELDELLAISNFDFEQYQTHRPEIPTDGNVRTLALVMIKDKYDFIVGALDAVIAQEGLQPSDRSRALELIVADYISGK